MLGPRDSGVRGSYCEHLAEILLTHCPATRKQRSLIPSQPCRSTSWGYRSVLDGLFATRPTLARSSHPCIVDVTPSVLNRASRAGRRILPDFGDVPLHLAAFRGRTSIAMRSSPALFRPPQDYLLPGLPFPLHPPPHGPRSAVRVLQTGTSGRGVPDRERSLGLEPRCLNAQLPPRSLIAVQPLVADRPSALPGGVTISYFDFRRKSLHVPRVSLFARQRRGDLKAPGLSQDAWKPGQAPNSNCLIRAMFARQR